MLTDDKYYNLRKEIRKLYKNDTRLNGDICSRILEVRDKYKCVESISVALGEYLISIDLAKGTPYTKADEVANVIWNRLAEFIISNKSELNIEDEAEFDIFTNPENFLFCDFTILGDSITFYL